MVWYETDAYDFKYIICNYITHRMKQSTMWEFKLLYYCGNEKKKKKKSWWGDGISRTDVAIMFYSLQKDLSFIEQMGLIIPIHSIFFCRVCTWAGPVRSISCRVNGSEHI